jgi:hypothetical protein
MLTVVLPIVAQAPRSERVAITIIGKL